MESYTYISVINKIKGNEIFRLMDFDSEHGKELRKFIVESPDNKLMPNKWMFYYEFTPNSISLFERSIKMNLKCDEINKYLELIEIMRVNIKYNRSIVCRSC